ncbi:MAG TPA: radical SAM protein [Anaerolineae bacterium]|nr:radical SAM protein [Anaerolineae bacterium]
MLSAIALYPANAAEPAERGFDACGAPDAPGDPFEALLARLRQEYVPFSAMLELTHVCNLDCVMCYNVPLAEPELSTAEWLDVLEQLAAAGTLRLTLSGGEILTRRDFFTIAERARALGFALSLKTNGTLLTPESADRLAALDPTQVDISLLGATEATFDAVAGSRRTLSRVLRGVQLLQERGVRVKLNTLLLDLNVAERGQMIDLAQELGVQYEQVFKISADDNGRDRAGQYQLSRQQMVGVYQADQTPFQPAARTVSSRTCQVGLSSCLISPYGEVYPCNELRISAGSLTGVRGQPFAEIWRTAPVLDDLRSRHTYGNLPECQVCPINRYCEGRCAGLAWKEHGDPYGGHSLACQQAQARFEQQNPSQQAPQTPLQARTPFARSHGHPPSNGHNRQPIPLVGV